MSNPYSGFGIVFLALVGMYIDYRLGNTHLWTIIGVILGIIYLAYEIWKMMRQN